MDLFIPTIINFSFSFWSPWRRDEINQLSSFIKRKFDLISWSAANQFHWFVFALGRRPANNPIDFINWRSKLNINSQFLQLLKKWNWLLICLRVANKINFSLVLSSFPTTLHSSFTPFHNQRLISFIYFFHNTNKFHLVVNNGARWIFTSYN